jgi:hypothetical protein
MVGYDGRGAMHTDHTWSRIFANLVTECPVSGLDHSGWAIVLRHKFDFRHTYWHVVIYHTHFMRLTEIQFNEVFERFASSKARKISCGFNGIFDIWDADRRGNFREQRGIL